MSGGANPLTAVLVGVQLAAFERPAALTIPRGTDIPVTLDENVTLKRDQVGNTFTAHITRDILVAGVVAIRAGAPAQVVLVEGEDTPGAGGGGGLLKGAVVGAGGGLAWGLLDHGSQRVEIDTPLVFGLREPVRVE